MCKNIQMHFMNEHDEVTVDSHITTAGHVRMHASRHPSYMFHMSMMSQLFRFSWWHLLLNI